MATQMQSPLNQRVIAHSLPATQEAATRALSHMMGSADNWAMFKGHHTLNVRNLLHLQNQLDELARKHEQDDPNFEMNELDEVLYKYSELYSFSQGYLFSCYLADLRQDRALVAYAKVSELLEPEEKNVANILRYSRARLSNHPAVWAFLSEAYQDLMHGGFSGMVALYVNPDGGALFSFANRIVGKFTRVSNPILYQLPLALGLRGV